MADFIEIVDCIFVNKHKYKFISDKDKENAFYMINKKFSLQFPKTAASYNHKDIDRVSVIDLWFNKFKNTEPGIPYWYWAKSPFKKDKKKKLSGPDTKKIIEEYNLTENEFNFIQDYFPDDLDFELKMLKRWK